MTRRTYFYHLNFELYPTPFPPNVNGHPPAKLQQKTSRLEKVFRDVYLPTETEDIFRSDLPAHASTRASDSLGKWVPKSSIGSTVSAKSKNEPVIDCGNPSESRHSSESISQPSVPLTLETAARDWRFGSIRVKSIDMSLRSQKDILIPKGEATEATATAHERSRSLALRARLEPLGDDGIKHTNFGWGIVHLYRDGEETNGLQPTSSDTSLLKQRGAQDDLDSAHTEENAEQKKTMILCIPAVPSYMTPRDFLGWVGEKTIEDVSHFRMIMTGRMNRYMVLMKFRDGDMAKKWRDAWDGRVFNGMEPENCHVMFIKSVTFQIPQSSTISHDTSSFPDMRHDPFTPNLSSLPGDTSAASLALKPFPPPTPSLVELPTCPVCLERMDDTTGLLTIPCQHVFHCACLQKWKGSGCPVCRHTQPTTSLSRPFGASASDLCQVCDCSEDLWICLICGNVGCGRYKGGHAKEHWKETAHNYALEIETQYVWDYASDIWVHRLIQTKGDGKLVELPSDSRTEYAATSGGESNREDGMEMVPSAKLENIGMEYTHLLTSQLDSQRVYYEDVVKKAVDKAAAASRAAESAAAKAEEALTKLKELSTEHARLRDDVIPSLERDRDRMTAKAEKSSELARAMTKSFQEEKQVGKGLMERIGHLNDGMAKMSKELSTLKEENADLKEQNRDLSLFISGQEKLKEIEGQLGEDISEGTVSLPERKEEKGKGKGRGKGRGK